MQNKAVWTGALGVVALATWACSSVAPVKITAGDQCFRCRRYISDERVATETIDSNHFVSKFRGPGCMAKYLVAHPEDRSPIFVTDYVSGKMMPPAKAFYVREIVDRKTNETDYRAFRDRSAADAFASSSNAAVVTWDAVLEQAR